MMGMTAASVTRIRTVRATLVLAVLFIASFHIWPTERTSTSFHLTENTLTSIQNASLAVPEEYSPPSTQSDFCIDRFTTRYFSILQQGRIDYCNDRTSTSGLTCFHTPRDFHEDEHIDSVCIGQQAKFLKDRGKFVLDCRPPTQEPAIALMNTQEYWSGTGARPILHEYIQHAEDSTTALPTETKPRHFIILVKREGSENLFHCLHEQMSLLYTRDLLRMTRNPKTGEAYYNYPADRANTRIVILDKHDDGPYWENWKMFSDHNPIRLADLDVNHSTGDIIIPLAGLGNPTWNDNWEARGCVNEMRGVFVRQLLEHYDIQDDRNALPPENLTMTIIDRKVGRQLLGLEGLVNAVRLTYPDVHVQVVDWAVLPFKQQIEMARRTDIMVGVHGAGLTHGLFMKRNLSAMIEILPRESVDCYHAMAMENGLRYFRGHGKVAEAKPDWHDEDVTIDKDKFMILVDHAVKSLYNRPGRFREMWSTNDD